MTVGIATREAARSGLFAGSKGATVRVAKIAVAILLLAAVYWAADWRAVLQAATTLNPPLLAAALVLFVPQTLISALRWRGLVQPLCLLTMTDALRQTLAASALNLVVPSKLGDLSKAAMLPLAGGPRRSAAALAVAEKGADLLMLALLCGLGWLGLGTGSLACLLIVVVALAIASPKRKRGPSAHPLSLARRVSVSGWLSLMAWTLVLWLLHLAQIGLFLWAAGVEASCGDALARVPLAIFAGLLPISFCGLGTRDAALVYLFSDLAAPSTMAVVGLLTSLRYLVPGAVGALFVGKAFGPVWTGHSATKTWVT